MANWWDQYPDADAPKSAPNAAGGNWWDQYPDAGEKAAPTVGVVEDVARTAPAAAVRGLTHIPGFGGDVQNLVRRGIDYFLPPNEKQLAARAEADRNSILFSSKEIQDKLKPVTGDLYEPQTAPGKIFGAGVEAVASMPMGGASRALPSQATKLLPQVTSAVGSGVGGESAGLALKDTPLETPARIIGSVAGGVIAPKTITPFTNQNTPARQASVDLLESKYIPLTAGQKLGSPTLQSIENTAATSTGGIRAGERINERQATAFDRAVTDMAAPRPQVQGNAPDPRVLTETKDVLGKEYDRIFRNREMTYDHALGVAMDNAVRKAGGSLPTANAANIKTLSDVRADIANTVVQNQGKITGQQYQEFRSDLTTMARDAYRVGNSKLGEGAKELRDVLDARFAATLPPKLAAELDRNNRRWANMKSMIDASARSTTGHITPQNLVSTQKVGRSGQFAQRAFPMDELAAAGREVLKPLPAAERGYAAAGRRLLAPLIGGGGATWLGGGPVATAAAAVASPIAARAALSGIGQRYLGNQLGPIQAREAIARSLLEQAMRGR